MFAACCSASCSPGRPFAAPPPVAGTYAPPDGKPQVSATLAVTPGTPSVLDIAMARIGDARPVARYDVELSKRLHVIAVGEDLRVFLHEHPERPGVDGHFRVPVRFPQGGGWHVYADAVPSALGQQVMRFDVSLGPTGAKLPAGLLLHVTAPKAGTHLLRLQFSAGRRVRTVPFVVAVA